MLAYQRFRTDLFLNPTRVGPGWRGADSRFVSFENLGNRIPISCGDLPPEFFFEKIHEIRRPAVWRKGQDAADFGSSGAQDFEILVGGIVRDLRAAVDFSDRNVT